MHVNFPSRLCLPTLFSTMCIIKLVARPLLLHRLFPFFPPQFILAFMEFFSSSLILQAMRAISLLLLTINLAIASVSLSHKPGYCNTYGNCGKSRCLANHYHVPSLSLLLRQVRVTREIKINMWKGFRLHLLFSRTN